MKPTQLDPVARLSADPLAGRVDQLRALFPEAFTEGKVDPARLRAALGDLADDSPERYTFTWAGKRDAIRILQMPTRATLVPCPEESVNWESTRHLFVGGDNLEVLKLLFKPYFGQVKMVYIDPPYNTGNDFIYPDNFADPLSTYLRLTGQQDEAGNLLTSNPETSGRYHSAWLSMMYPRLFLARQLLREDGVIFVSIDDHEVHNLRMLMNEIFGEENFIAIVIWQKVYAPKNTAKYFSEDHDYIVVYARNAEIWRPELLPRTEEANARYANPDHDSRGVWKSDNILASLTSGQRGRQFQRTGFSSNLYEVVSPSGKQFIPPPGNCWRFSQERFAELNADHRIWWGPNGDNMPALKRFLSEVMQGIVPQTLWRYKDVGHTQEASQELRELFPDAEGVAFPTPKPVRLMKRLLQVATSGNTDDLILDFFSGSCSLAQAVLEINREDSGNRRFLMVQLPEPLVRPLSVSGNTTLATIADIGKERIRRAIAQMQGVSGGQLPLLETRATPEDLGFKVFKLAASTFRNWSGVAALDVGAYARQMDLFADPLAEDWTVEKVIAEVALKEAGFGLNYRVEPAAAVSGQTVYRVIDPEKEQAFAICLDDKVQLENLKPLGLERNALFVCRASALDDEAAANLALQCRLKVI
jgi:adenine-specific DNA-methyltransferase